jgi:hypothetical protein
MLIVSTKSFEQAGEYLFTMRNISQNENQIEKSWLFPFNHLNNYLLSLVLANLYTHLWICLIPCHLPVPPKGDSSIDVALSPL